MRLCLHIVTRIMLINATSSLDTEYKNRSMMLFIMLECSLFRTFRTQALRMFTLRSRKIHLYFSNSRHMYPVRISRKKLIEKH